MEERENCEVYTEVFDPVDVNICSILLLIPCTILRNKFLRSFRNLESCVTMLAFGEQHARWRACSHLNELALLSTNEVKKRQAAGPQCDPFLGGG